MIVPAILTDNKEDFRKMLELCAGFADYVQIDIMDGLFVPSKSISQQDLCGLKASVTSEAHLMVKEPLLWLDAFGAFGAKRIIYHFEIKNSHEDIIHKIRKEGFEVGLGINPSTEISDFEFLIDKVDSILFLSVEPGFYGAPFIPSILGKITELKKMFPKKIVGIDGGIKLDNAAIVKKSQVDYICVGSAILKDKNPAGAYQNFLKILNE